MDKKLKMISYAQRNAGDISVLMKKDSGKYSEMQTLESSGLGYSFINPIKVLLVRSPSAYPKKRPIYPDT